MKRTIHYLVTTLLSMLSIVSVRANNLQITNLTVFGRNTDTAYAQFDISWDNSWRYTNLNHDAAWVFFKIRDSSDTSNYWQQVMLEGTGTNPKDSYPGNGTGTEIIVPPDRTGMFIRRAGEGSGTITAQNVRVPWNFATNGLTIYDNVRLQAMAIEMVYVPEGSFYVGDGTITNFEGQFEAGTTGAPFQITNEAYEITLGGGGAGSLGNHNATNMQTADDFNDTTVTNLPADFPKGYAPFYCMKYEVTQGQYCDFLNLLTRAQQNSCTASRDPDEYTMNGRTNVFRGTVIRCPSVVPDAPTNVVFGCDGNENKVFNEDDDCMDRACCTMNNYWRGSAAFLDWSCLRPMTELEYEKSCRGTNTPVANEFAWGNTNITIQTTYDETDGPVGSGRESALPVTANCNTGRTMDGSVRAGLYATNGPSREASGASYWGIMDLSGNSYERLISVGNEEGRAFTGSHGDGYLTVTGYADQPGWPASTASGARGGEWYLGSSFTRVSDRNFGASPSAWIGVGVRGVRDAPPGVGP